ncbi:MAG: PorP/SprF family type IX secretion system membrane protein [Bacteroidota bacterium]
MRKLILSFFIFPVFCQAQQLEQFSHYWTIPAFYNPGACGNKNVMSASLITRKQWTGYDGSPFGTSFVGDYTFSEKKFSLGLISGYDQIGFYKTFETRFQAGYHFTSSANLKVSIGLESSFTNFRTVNPNWVMNQPDPSVPSGSTNDYGFQMGTGIYLSNQNFFSGLSVRQLLATKYKNANITLSPHYFLSGGYNFGFYTMMLTPSVFVESDGTSTQIAANANLLLNDKIGFGMGYRLNDAVILNLNYNFQRWKIGYAYDITTSVIQYYSRGSHEVFVSWRIPHINEWKLVVEKKVVFL